METIGCVFCHNSGSEPVIEENGFSGRKCSNCGLIFISPRPSEREMHELYESGEARSSPERLLGKPDSAGDRAHARTWVRRLRRYVAGGSVLDIGPGVGTFLARARRAGFDVYGVELDSTAAEFIRAERGIPCASSLDSVASLGIERFDVVYHCDVISHFYDPIKEFRRINELLVDGGYSVFETGNLGDVDPKYYGQYESFQYPDHLFFFSDRSLDLLLERTGFERVNTYRCSNLAAVIIYKQLSRMVAALRAPHRGNGAAPAPPPRRTSASGLALIIRDVYDWLEYFMTYDVGRLVRLKHAPATIIVVARKL